MIMRLPEWLWWRKPIQAPSRTLIDVKFQELLDHACEVTGIRYRKLQPLNDSYLHLTVVNRINEIHSVLDEATL